MKGAIGEEADEVEVRVDRLDNILAASGFPRLDLMKIDVELHEVAALTGLKETLAASRPSILIEILEDALGSEIEALLDGLDYLYLPIREDVGTLNAGKPVASRNVLLCRRDVFEALKPLFPELQPAAALRRPTPERR